MPVVEPPPRFCPIWGRDSGMKTDSQSAWHAASTKVRLNRSRPEFFARWARRMSWKCAFSVPLFLGVGIAAEFKQTVVAFILLGGFILVAIAVFLTLQTGKSKFRALWQKEQGGPVNPRVTLTTALTPPFPSSIPVLSTTRRISRNSRL